MKKVVSILLILALLCGLAVTIFACTPREEILKLYMPGEYIDEDIFEAFEAWYLEETGKKVTVKLYTFDTVENIQKAVEESKADYDLLCPSDYMVEYLINKELVIPFDKEIVGEINAETYQAEYVELAKTYDPELKYAVPYMYGTLGIVYDYSKTHEDITSWEALFGTEYAGHRSIKDSMRDTYAAACLYNNSKLTGDAKKSVQEVFNDASKATAEAAGRTIAGIIESTEWDIDNIKYEMAAKSSNVWVALMWSCDAGYVMNDYEDENGEEQTGNRDLRYYVPDEGGNVYIDNFVINKYAENVDAANYFLKFLSDPEIAVMNSEYAGAVSIVKAAYDELYTYYTEDEDGIFEDVDPEWKDMFIEMMFPSERTLSRCGMMRDFGANLKNVSDMWADYQ